MKLPTLVILLVGMSAALAARETKPSVAPKASGTEKIFKAGAATSNITPPIGTPTVMSRPTRAMTTPRTMSRRPKF